MLAHAKEASGMIRGKTRAEFESDRQLNLALVRLLEIVGEAAGRVSEQERARHRAIPWPEIIGLRNRLIHGYDAVDLGVLWQIVTEDLPPLMEALERALASQGTC